MHHLSSRYIPCDGRLTASTYFNPRSPWGERPGYPFMYCVTFYFNPRSPHGERHFENKSRNTNTVFQSTLPAWGATFHEPSDEEWDSFQSTLPAWGATAKDQLYRQHQIISIHAPRMGSDELKHKIDAWIAKFQSTLPAGGATFDHGTAADSVGVFQSTLPAGGATSGCIDCRYRVQFQSTLPAGGATPSSPRAVAFWRFQSTLPAGGATYNIYIKRYRGNISIHAPRRGSDLASRRLKNVQEHFNPRSPQGERHLN